MSRGPTTRREWVLAVGVAASASITSPSRAWAGNELHPRTPVLWTDAQCLTVFDRSRSSVFALTYTIPYEDTDVTPDEVDQSRTHQFFGFCRDHHLEEILPSWIAEADLAEADANGLGDAAGVDTELDVLDNSPEWAGCFVRITADAERRPITFAAAAEPVAWDIGALPAGAWVVEGYTFEPWANEWWPHPGVFKIIDDPDPAATGPAAALSFTEQVVEFGDEALITGCVDAMPGATMTASYAISGFGTAPDWQVIAADVPADSGSFELSFAPPPETISNPLLIKLDVVDPLGRTWTTHGNAYIVVTENFGGDDEDGCGGGFVSCETGDGGDADSGSETSDTTGSETGPTGETGPSQATHGDGACNCTAATGGPVEPWRWALALGACAWGRRRLSRRRAASDPSAPG